MAKYFTYVVNGQQLYIMDLVTDGMNAKDLNNIGPVV